MSITAASPFAVEEKEAIFVAKRILDEKFREAGVFAACDPGVVKMFLAAHLSAEPVEHFCAMFLNTQLQLIQFETMFTGTIDQTQVYPREIVRAAIRHNAKAVLIAHNHPSGSPRPSQADKALTKRIKDALELIDCRFLDHMIVAGAEVFSFAEEGLC